MEHKDQIKIIRSYYTDESLASAFKGNVEAFEKLMDWVQGWNVLDMSINKHDITLRQAILNEYREFFFGRMSQWHARKRILEHIAGTLVTHDRISKEGAVRNRRRKKTS